MDQIEDEHQPENVWTDSNEAVEESVDQSNSNQEGRDMDVESGSDGEDQSDGRAERSEQPDG